MDLEGRRGRGILWMDFAWLSESNTLWPPNGTLRTEGTGQNGVGGEGYGNGAGLSTEQQRGRND